jgi:hypothetical protein
MERMTKNVVVKSTGGRHFPAFPPVLPLVRSIARRVSLLFFGYPPYQIIAPMDSIVSAAFSAIRGYFRLRAVAQERS